jgi:mRNA-degrading endonuclease RelE of RelBE toxin-antitoxin system
MSFRILTIPPFDRQLKRLAKKYPSIKEDLLELAGQLVHNPTSGKPLGKNCFKVRMAISSKGKGKSGGARLITNIAVEKENIYLLSIYDKSKKADMTDSEMAELLSYII